MRDMSADHLEARACACAWGFDSCVLNDTVPTPARAIDLAAWVVHW